MSEERIYLFLSKPDSSILRTPRTVRVKLSSGGEIENFPYQYINLFILFVEGGKEQFLVLESQDAFLKLYCENKRFAAEIHADCGNCTHVYTVVNDEDERLMSREALEGVVKEYFDNSNTKDLFKIIHCIEADDTLTSPNAAETVANPPKSENAQTVERLPRTVDLKAASGRSMKNCLISFVPFYVGAVENGYMNFVTLKSQDSFMFIHRQDDAVAAEIYPCENGGKTRIISVLNDQKTRALSHECLMSVIGKYYDNADTDAFLETIDCEEIDSVDFDAVFVIENKAFLQSCSQMEVLQICHDGVEAYVAVIFSEDCGSLKHRNGDAKVETPVKVKIINSNKGLNVNKYSWLDVNMFGYIGYLSVTEVYGEIN